MKGGENETPVGYTPGTRAPDFTALALCEKEFKEVTLSSFQGKAVLLVFYPVDFCYIAPTELVLLQEAMSDENILAISTGSPMGKLAWASTTLDKGGIEGVTFPLVSDMTGDITKKFGFLNEPRGYEFRGYTVVDSKGTVVCRSLSDLPLGLGVAESLRIYKAADTGCSAPTWTPDQYKPFSTRLCSIFNPASSKKPSPVTQAVILQAPVKQETSDTSSDSTESNQGVPTSDTESSDSIKSAATSGSIKSNESGSLNEDEETMTETIIEKPEQSDQTSTQSSSELSSSGSRAVSSEFSSSDSSVVSFPAASTPESENPGDIPSPSTSKPADKPQIKSTGQT
ncbi:hyphally regulated cell wall protein 3 isoform X2 [Eurytemora carolleeae]|uniref:hyphally regulated cell wall protein 3 isoform X2 n=1 Tax=Eurytemora carolleeae TaxID=1294199 RepID=UPI000C75DD7E|nr:hyphally regulated cell wall protein 3 isoform X2 [Eurytemora carolleeae]|eukprot:XP_023327147.1 hyphally regulated cell wall protein 3-like isoform X2 [Eurytemora affinis]